MNALIGHDEAFELLPWLATGTLPAEQREIVERHVCDCLPCRVELKEQRALHTLVRRHPAVHISPEHGFELLRGQLDGRRRGHRLRCGRRRGLARRLSAP